MKTIVTHISPDFDALTSCWLIKRFLPGWDDAEIVYVPAGSTLNNMQADENDDIIHIDTGLGRFDHHQTNEHTSATKLMFEHLVKQNYINKKHISALERIVNFVNDIDHFAEAYFPDAIADRHDFSLYQIIEGLKAISTNQDKMIEIIFSLLDAELQIFKNKVRAEEDLKQALVFQSHWGKSLAIESKNEETIKLALKMGYSLVIRKDPDKGHVRIKTLPQKKLDLTPLYNKILETDKKGTWFLHISKNMLLNSSSKQPNFTPTSLTLKRLIEIIKGV